MRIDLNARIRTSDGHDAGNVHRVLVDPSTERITGFVVSTRRLLGRDVIVGEDAFAKAEREGDVITLNLSKRELDAQPTFADSDSSLRRPAGRVRMSATPCRRSPFSGPPTPRSLTWASGNGPRSRRATREGPGRGRRGNGRGHALRRKIERARELHRPSRCRTRTPLRRRKVAEISRNDILRIAEGEVRLAVDREEIIPREHETGTR